MCRFSEPGRRVTIDRHRLQPYDTRRDNCERRNTYLLSINMLRHPGASRLSNAPASRSATADDVGNSAPAPLSLIPECAPGDLVLVRVLGRGGQKCVSLCRHTPSGALVVRCTIADNLALAAAAQNPALAQRLRDEFRSELATLAQLKHHKNIVKLLAVVSDAAEARAIAAQRPGAFNGAGADPIANIPGFGGAQLGGVGGAARAVRLHERAAAAAAAAVDGGGDAGVAGAGESTLSFLLEYCGNGSLRDAMNNAAIELSVPLRARIAKSLARAVLFLHSQPMPVIHHDLKPGNVLLTHDFTVRLCDFGLSKTQAQTSGLAASTRSVAGTVR